MKLLIKRSMFYAGAIMVLWACSKEDPVDKNPFLAMPPVQMVHVTHVLQFGEDLGAGKINPAFEYILFNEFQPVLAVEEGLVDVVVKNPVFDDYEIRITLNSTWTIIYDHVKDPAVVPGDKVLPGQFLGNVGEGNRVELQLNHKDGNSYCPFSYASSTFVDAHKDFTEEWCMKDEVAHNKK